MANKVLSEKSLLFAKRIIKLSNYLIERKEYIISKQVVRSGTSIGANIAESEYAQSKKDLVNKYQIALKEANETKYWLKLLENDYLEHNLYLDLVKDVEELMKILISSINKLKKSIK